MLNASSLFILRYFIYLLYAEIISYSEVCITLIVLKSACVIFFYNLWLYTHVYKYIYFIVMREVPLRRFTSGLLPFNNQLFIAVKICFKGSLLEVR